MALAVAVAGCLLTAGASAQTVTNGNFEAQDFPAWPGYLGITTANGTNPGSITGWTASTNAGVGINPSSDPAPACCGADPFSPATGPETGKFAFMQVTPANNNTTSLSQTVGGFTVGGLYELRYRDGHRDGDAADTATLTADIGGASLITTPLGSDWTDRVLPFTANNTSLTLTFTANNPAGNDQTISLDEVSIVQVPEPAAVSLLVLGGAGLLARRRRD